jgi:hypothetical protein
MDQPHGQVKLMTAEERDALVAEGRAVVSTQYPCWRFGSVNPFAAIRGHFRAGLTSVDDVRRQCGEVATWPFFVRMSALWLVRVADAGAVRDDACQCFLCQRRIIQRLDLGRVVFAWPDDPGFPEASGASVIACTGEGGSLDGSELQDMLVRAGVLVPAPVEKPCEAREACSCAAAEASFPTVCYRLAIHAA